MNGEGLGYTVPIEEPGWVDALCTCENGPFSHQGLYCPNRAPEEQPVNPEFQPEEGGE